jgi:hypothetical protein
VMHGPINIRSISNMSEQVDDQVPCILRRGSPVLKQTK